MLTVILALALSDPQVIDGPSFDCTAAFAAVENEICSDPELARLDLAMARRYVAVRRGMSAEARTVLADDQRRFLDARDEWFKYRTRWADFPDLAARMTDRIAFLDALRPAPASDMTGVWRNAAGVAAVESDGDRVSIRISAAHPVNARWICMARAEGRIVDGVLEAVMAYPEDARLRATLNDGVLRVEEVAPAADPLSRPWCGAGGHVDGAYLPSIVPHRSGG